MIAGIIAAVVVVLVGLYVISVYNRLVALFNRTQNAFAQI